MSRLVLSDAQRCALLCVMREADLPLFADEADRLWAALSNGQPWSPFPSLSAWQEAQGSP